MTLKVSFLVLSLSLLGIASCISATGGSVDYGYVGPKGAEKWASVNPSYATCSNGKAQSPIDLTKAKIVLNNQLKSLDREYNPVNATLVNDINQIGVEFGGEAGGIIIDGKKYSLKQMHWHTPAEHKLDGKQHDAELHLVHKSQDKSIAVVGIIYQIGKPDPIISKIQDKLVELEKVSQGGHKEAQIAIGTFDVSDLKRKAKKYYRYVGSLTTPPCKEGVIFSILGKVRTLSPQQLQLLKAPLSPEFKMNARPVQPLNARKIEMYHLK